MYTVVKGLFYDEGHSKSIKYRIIPFREYMLYYDNSYESVFTGHTIDQCKQFLKDMYYFQTLLNKKNETHNQKVSTGKG